MALENLAAYEIIEHRFLDDIHSDSVLLRHKKTGARVALLPNEDNNKVFYIGFRTPPFDSTGAAHIVEHTVLCGSKNFPVKDPFVELCKGSLNTFLNAMTFPDKTVYPVASCNDFDFQNLMNVYLDAVFYPNIYREEKIFKQEGWHYELENKDDDLKINGVVYSEMKGAFSDPDDILERQILNGIFPDSPYGVESGGDPDVIPELTYEDFLDFHSRYYHPSNSYIFLYGDMDMEEKLDYIDKEYLSKFDYLEIDSRVPFQKAFDEPRNVRYEYSITETEDDKDKTYLNLTYCLKDYTDKEIPIVLRAFEYAFSGNPAARLKKRIIEAGIGDEFYVSSDCSVCQNIIGFYAKGANESDKDKFVEIIKDEIQKTIEEGFDKDTILAFLVREEFKYREADFGRYPKGLVYGLDMLETWLYDDMLAFDQVESIETYKKLKEAVNTDYYEKILEEGILNNNHSVLIVGAPKKGLTSIKNKDLEEKLAKIKASLSDSEIEDIVKGTKELKEYQESEDRVEDLEKIKLLKVSDIDKKSRSLKNKVETLDDMVFVKQNIFTSGIAYVTMLFDLGHLSFEEIKYVPVLNNLLGKLDTVNMKYGEMSNAFKMYTGGMGSGTQNYCHVKTGDIKTSYEIKVKFLYENKEKAFELIKEMLINTKFEDKKLIKEYISEMRSQGEGMLTSVPHGIAVTRATSYFDPAQRLNDALTGLESVRFIQELDDNIDERMDSLIEMLKNLSVKIFRAENMITNLTISEGDDHIIDDVLVDFRKALFTKAIEKNELKYEVNTGNEGFISAGAVQYVAKAGEFKSKGLEYTGAFNVLKTILGYDYLWNNVRVKGGAYGCFAIFTVYGTVSIVSYRDPHLNNTLKIYSDLIDYIENFECSDREMNQFIIGAISDIDLPQTASAEGKANFGHYMSGVNQEDIQKKRDEILACTKEDIRKLAPHIKAAFEKDNICVVGAESKINDNKNLFDKIENLIK